MVLKTTHDVASSFTITHINIGLKKSHIPLGSIIVMTHSVHSRTRRYDHNIPILYTTYWLSVKFSVDYNAINSFTLSAYWTSGNSADWMFPLQIFCHTVQVLIGCNLCCFVVSKDISILDRINCYSDSSFSLERLKWSCAKWSKFANVFLAPMAIWVHTTFIIDFCSFLISCHPVGQWHSRSKSIRVFG